MPIINPNPQGENFRKTKMHGLVGTCPYCGSVFSAPVDDAEMPALPVSNVMQPSQHHASSAPYSYVDIDDPAQE